MFSNGELPNANDLVIALMGMTGSAKSSLISLCADQQVEIGHDLQSCTQDPAKLEDIRLEEKSQPSSNLPDEDSYSPTTNTAMSCLFSRAWQATGD
ncbi:hypothetical protein FHL15_010587 [Xylaria flabelliformis]|uniref:G domain-containing protein n=1 Tax=Xylaria flabelliformis TaxID=2512241 RepID=A0A553HKR4_9PEZI|nr:hypothetical protein FHL15_010587 [Xylaria flabelliformis]